MCAFSSVYKLRPINKLASSAFWSGEHVPGIPLVKKRSRKQDRSPVSINTDRLPDNSIENRKWMFRQWLLQNKGAVQEWLGRVQYIYVERTSQPFEDFDEYEIWVRFKSGKKTSPLFDIPLLAKCHEVRNLCRCYPNRMQADCALNLIGRLLSLPVLMSGEGRMAEEKVEQAFPKEYAIAREVGLRAQPYEYVQSVAEVQNFSEGSSAIKCNQDKAPYEGEMEMANRLSKWKIPRPRNVVRLLVGSEEKVTGVNYKKVVPFTKIASGVLCLKIGTSYFSVEELLSIGFLKDEFRKYSGLIDDELCRQGREELRTRFGIVVARNVR